MCQYCKGFGWFITSSNTNPPYEYQPCLYEGNQKMKLACSDNEEGYAVVNASNGRRSFYITTENKLYEEKENFDLLMASRKLDKQKDFLGVEASQRLLDSI